MNTKVVVIVNQKGGCGKTTIAMQLAGTLGREGKKVLVVDADPQGTALRWAANADDKKLFPASISGLSAAGGKVHREIGKHVGEYDLIFVDCPPAIDSLIPQSALMVADVALIPVIPSPADLWAANGIQALIERMQINNEKLKAYIVPNMCAWTNLTKEALTVMDGIGMKRTSAFLSNRNPYRQSAIIGGTVFDLKGEGAEKAQEELEKLKEELLNILNIPESVA